MQSSIRSPEIASSASLRITPDAMESMDFKQKIFHRPWVNREHYILSRLPEFQSILHLGCSDAPFTAALLQANELLHLKLLKQNPNIIGFDLSTTGTQLLRRACPDSKFICGNAEALDEHFGPNTFDLMIAGEMVEHLSNPGSFFEACAKVLSPDGVLLLTVPNTFGIRRYIHSLFGVENYHPDHTFYFSENTLGTLAGRYGFSVFRSRYYGSPMTGSWLKRALYTCIETIPAYFLGNHFLDGLVIELKKEI
jgi:2-polyprenyl-3-methyl-5-hydroxy-6-metoxy-1,4-benzoquinol methylase